eukprot:1568111-Amphidinium_carterae.1
MIALPETRTECTLSPKQLRTHTHPPFVLPLTNVDALWGFVNCLARALGQTSTLQSLATEAKDSVEQASAPPQVSSKRCPSFRSIANECGPVVLSTQNNIAPLSLGRFCQIFMSTLLFTLSYLLKF